MDKTPEYILMCEKATEIQELWDLEDDTNYIGLIIGDYAMTEVYMGWFINSSVKILKSNNQGEGYVWLPRQDQLQDMIDVQKYADEYIDPKVTELDILMNEFGYFWRHNLLLVTLEQLWLMFVMEENYNKSWNGKDWVLDKIEEE